MVAKDAFDTGTGDDRKTSVTFADNGLINGANRWPRADVKRRASEEVE